MKFIVDSLPYYGNDCPFMNQCYAAQNEFMCPRYWDKYKVTDDNSHECVYLKEIVCYER